MGIHYVVYVVVKNNSKQLLLLKSINLGINALQFHNENTTDNL
jgi:hypothetical protein